MTGFFLTTTVVVFQLKVTGIWQLKLTFSELETELQILKKKKKKNMLYHSTTISHTSVQKLEYLSYGVPELLSII